MLAMAIACGNGADSHHRLLLLVLERNAWNDACMHDTQIVLTKNSAHERRFEQRPINGPERSGKSKMKAAW